MCYFFLPRGSRVPCKIMSSSPSVDQVCVPANCFILINLLLRKMAPGLSLKGAVPLKGHCRLRRRSANINECMEIKKEHLQCLPRSWKQAVTADKYHSEHPSIYLSKQSYSLTGLSHPLCLSESFHSANKRFSNAALHSALRLSLWCMSS